MVTLTAGAAAGLRVAAADDADEITAEAAVAEDTEGSDVKPLETTCCRRTLQCIVQ
jgi:hypothetical protein